MNTEITYNSDNMVNSDFQLVEGEKEQNFTTHFEVIINIINLYIFDNFFID